MQAYSTEGTFGALDPSQQQQLTVDQQHQLLAKSLSAMLCARTGISSADPLLGNSCSSSPCIKPQQEASTTSGSMDTACIQLPPPALPMHARPLPAAALGAPQHQHLQQHGSAGHASQQSSHSVGDSMPAHATPSSLFKACRLGDPCCYGSPATHSCEQPAAAASAEAGQQPVEGSPAFTVEVPTCLGQALAAAHQAPAAQQQGSPAADDAAACQDTTMESPAAAAGPQQQQQQPHRRASALNSPKSWLYELVTCPFLFKPCPQCSATNSGREVLITYYDTDNPTQGYCTYCPQRHSHPRLLQIRRSTYHEVVKAADVSRLTDVSGIQHYVINGAKVLFLRPRPQPRPPKGVVAPARCAVDGRQLMDAHSSYCSLRCKLEVEDVVFAANFPSAQEEQQQAGAARPDSSSPGSALAGSFHKQSGHEGRRVVVPNHKRSSNAQASSGPAAAPQHSHDAGHNYDSSEDAAEGADGHCGTRHKRNRHMPSKFANAVVGGGYSAAVSTRGNGRQHRAHHASGSRVRDDTASDQAAAGGTTSPGGSPGLAGLAGLHLLHKGIAGEAGSRRASPCDSDDSGRSTTSSQRAHKRKRAPPCRSALQ